MKFLIILFLSTVLVASTAFAEQIFMVCDARDTEGDSETLQVESGRTYSAKLFIDTREDLIRFSYDDSFGDEKVYDHTITFQSNDYISGIKEFNFGGVITFHYDVKYRLFSTAYVGSVGNTLTFGRCF
ncbi:hypothetical protein SAMN05444004_11274 [Jannaschia faecimaris]|uniref:Uncharacterized protein n=2 Tax=Jannaschia faecimaris TaxID=1244108 RepID=A0A1H3SKY0_9RHOB|nr:hypothetical protein SAMN05444004_11274 [Jannaschia faecimaris]